jgi:hypothetical protein
MSLNWLGEVGIFDSALDRNWILSGISPKKKPLGDPDLAQQSIR